MNEWMEGWVCGWVSHWPGESACVWVRVCVWGWVCVYPWCRLPFSVLTVGAECEPVWKAPSLGHIDHQITPGHPGKIHSSTGCRAQTKTGHHSHTHTSYHAWPHPGFFCVMLSVVTLIHTHSYMFTKACSSALGGAVLLHAKWCSL